jgi:Second Messenger Oligonucleotide or Dinucleotide Synthetase domain
MAMTTAKAFEIFSERITPTSATRKKVDERRDAVAAVLKAAFPQDSDIRFQSARIIGSAGRNTATNPVADIDLMVVLDVDGWSWWTKYWWTSSDFLYRVRNAVNGESKVKKVGARGQAVRIFYADGLVVDVAAMVQRGPDDYRIPDGSSNWLKTNPIKHEQYLNDQNGKLSGDLKKIARFVKEWNKAHSSHLASFHLEMLVAHNVDELGANSRTVLRLFFDRSRRNLSVHDPAGYSGNLSRYLSWDAKSEAKASLKAARDRADLALAAEERGDHKEAIRLWGIILGEKFPTYE